MVDLKAIRKVLEAEADENNNSDDSGMLGPGGEEQPQEDSIMAGFVTPVSGWKTELNDFYVAAPLSIGTGILMALAFDYVRSKGNKAHKYLKDLGKLWLY